MEEILVVDDEPMIRSMMKETLAQMGYTVTAAGSVGEALDIYERDDHRFLAMVTDFHLADGTGLDIVNTVREHTTFVPVILTTGSMRMSAEDSFQAGFSAFFRKPFSCVDVGHEIDNLLGKAS